MSDPSGVVFPVDRHPDAAARPPRTGRRGRRAARCRPRRAPRSPSARPTGARATSHTSGASSRQGCQRRGRRADHRGERPGLAAPADALARAPPGTTLSRRPSRPTGGLSRWAPRPSAARARPIACCRCRMPVSDSRGTRCAVASTSGSRPAPSSPPAPRPFGRVIDNPDWLDLSDRTSSCSVRPPRWGHCAPCCRGGPTSRPSTCPRKRSVWDRLDRRHAHDCRVVTMPVRLGDGDLAGQAGGDLVHDLAGRRHWVAALDGPAGDRQLRLRRRRDERPRLDGRRRPERRVSMKRRDDVALAFLATPTDVFAVPGDAVEHSDSQLRAPSAADAAVRPALRTVSGGRLLRRNYVPGTDPGINDSLVLAAGTQLPARQAAPAVAGDGMPRATAVSCRSTSHRPRGPARS